ncbi:MAG: CPBP family glutamic-type intramembrane protease [Myxococcota bacterium]
MDDAQTAARTGDAGRGHSGSEAHDSRPGHGWWPYLLPYVGFLLAVEIGRRTPESAAGFMLFFKPAVPALLLLWFWRQGAYRELRGYRLGGGTALDVLVGVASAALWMVPFLFFDSVRELFGVDPAAGFDPSILGEGRETLALGVRLLGYAVVTPLFEELFIRSFVMRYADVYPNAGDFRRLPLARYTARSFWVTVVVFTMGHLTWEWPVAVAWVMATNAWFYWRGHLGSVVVVHGVANASILLFVAAFGDAWTDGQGHPLPLWFFI